MRTEEKYKVLPDPQRPGFFIIKKITECWIEQKDRIDLTKNITATIDPSIYNKNYIGKYSIDEIVARMEELERLEKSLKEKENKLLCTITKMKSKNL